MPVPAPASTVILLRPSAGSFEVLMVERNGRGMFGDIVVFPGGRVEEGDEVREPDEERDRAHRRAAIRELAEETGILLTPGGTTRAPAARGDDFYGEVQEGDMAVDSLVLVSRWVTPEFSPRRYDTRFYLASCVDPPAVEIDAEELVGHAWMSPADALGRHEAGEVAMILPTLAHLRWLAKRRSPEDALASASGADGRTLIRPIRVEDGSLIPIHLPAEEVS